MKTFETEKHNIPEGATHYCNENDETFFCWFKGVDSVNFEVLTDETRGEWVTGIPSDYINDSITEIPQQESKMNIDKLATQVEEVEWNGEGLPPVGVECEYKDGDEWYEVKVKYLSEWVIVIESLKSQGKLIDIKGTEISIDHSRFNDLKFRKPESPEEKEKREREEVCDLACESLFGESILNCRKDVADTVRCMIEAGYRLNG